MRSRVTKIHWNSTPAVFSLLIWYLCSRNHQILNTILLELIPRQFGTSFLWKNIPTHYCVVVRPQKCEKVKSTPVQKNLRYRIYHISPCRDNFLNVNIYYKQLTVEEIIQHPAFELLSLFSEVGGSLGLLIGASVLSVCEIIDFILVTISASCNARKIKTKNEESKETSSGDIDVDVGTKGRFIKQKESLSIW